MDIVERLRVLKDANDALEDILVSLGEVKSRLYNTGFYGPTDDVNTAMKKVISIIEENTGKLLKLKHTTQEEKE